MQHVNITGSCYPVNNNTILACAAAIHPSKITHSLYILCLWLSKNVRLLAYLAVGGFPDYWRTGKNVGGEPLELSWHLAVTVEPRSRIASAPNVSTEVMYIGHYRDLGLYVDRNGCQKRH